MTRRLAATGAALLLAAVSVALAERTFRIEIPGPPTRFLHDGANVLAAAERGKIETRLLELDRRGIEIGVAILPGLEGESIEDVSLAIAERWKPGAANQDDGALIALAVADRKVRIEVGYGLEGRLTDAAAGRIIRHLMVPEFREARYASGLSAGIEAIATLADGDPLPVADDDGDQVDPEQIILLLLVLFFLVVLPFVRRRYPSIWIDSGGWGRGVGGRSHGGGGSFGGSFGGGSFGGGGASGGW